MQTIDHDGLTLETRLGPARTTGDPRLVEGLVANLVNNAVRHNVPLGKAAIRTETRDARAVLTVTNAGPVILRGEIERLFQPFQRLDAERTTNANGTGLGLSIVHAVAAAHTADLTACALPGGGLEIEVGFPARD